MSEWQPINTAPTDGRDVDIMYPSGKGLRIVRCRWYDPKGESFPHQAGWVNFGEDGSKGIVCNVAPLAWRACDSKDSPSRKS